MSKGVLKEVALTIKVLTSRRSEFSSVRLAGRHRRRFAQFLWRHRGNDFLGLQNQQSHHPKTTSPPPKSKLPTSINNAIQQILPHKSQARKGSATELSCPTMDPSPVIHPLPSLSCVPRRALKLGLLEVASCVSADNSCAC